MPATSSSCSMRVTFATAAAATALLATDAIATTPLAVTIGGNITDYSLSINGVTWLKSGPTRVHGMQLQPTGPVSTSSSKDVLGEYKDSRQDFDCIPTGKLSSSASKRATEQCFSAIIRDYTQSGVPLVLFFQNHTTQRNGTASSPLLSVAKEQVSSAFPSFEVGYNSNNGASNKLGYMTYFDQMVGGMEEGTRYGEWTPEAKLVGGSMAGPTVLFDAEQNNAVVLSPWKNFLAGSAVPRTPLANDDSDKSSSSSSVLEFGLIGSITEVPAGFEFATAAFAGAGVNAAVSGFGDALLRSYGKAEAGASVTPWDGKNGDVTIAKLGVSTDNGAYLYYNTGPNATTEQDALNKVHDQSVATDVPFSYVRSFVVRTTTTFWLGWWTYFLALARSFVRSFVRVCVAE